MGAHRAMMIGLCRSVIPSDLPELTSLAHTDLERLLSTTLPVRRQTENETCPASVGSFPSPTSPSIYDLEKRNAFVKRVGTQLTLAGEPFRIVGPNVYWLGLDENVIPDPAYPSKQRVVEIFGVVSAMRGTAVRGHTLGISIGNPLSVEPELDVFNESAYESIDFAITVARVYGIKLLIPLVDNYNYYHGGKYQFIEWGGHNFSGTGADITPPDVGAFFYNDTSVVESFKRYITQHLNHVNQFTSVALKDDPTILGWESGNELSGARFGDGPAPANWTKEMGDLIKSLAPNHLFLDGSYGLFPETGQLENEVVDIFSNHYYPPNITILESDLALTNAVNRNYLAGEFDWTGAGDNLTTFLQTVGDTGTAGDFYWSLFGHDDQCCQYVEHDDGESFYYLRDDANYTAQGAILIKHASDVSGSQAPEILPEVSCPRMSSPASIIPPVVFNLTALGLP
ncbi:glycoside hydrolase [Stereum hirsutum FP-91666 SS1]|uniref:glycoside hydrolase n=1 Tax=Stereum hirsutum (strain FP-91666) TaxID=721885 RepID=UPI0004449A91|nr:glycoside hydrolase [Stereum hirsutum FP-91666 SS1]EIM84910.1 glycoside hydrolase [Stereum hirsutum FP-91666 SS1]